MCIAIYTPAGVILDKELLANCAENNSDGCGFTYINESHTGIRKIFVKKTLDFDTFYSQYERATRINPDSPFLVHFRIKTHGPKVKENCHPFMIDDDMVFIHNGIISGVGFDIIKSDTRLFNEKILQSLPIGWEVNDAILTLLEDFIGHSKLVTMNVDGDVEILNEDKGHWKDLCWFSNDSYKKRKPYNYGGNRGRTIPYNIYSQVRCIECGRYHQIKAMSIYKVMTQFYDAVCPVCVPILVSREDVDPDELVTAHEYVTYMNSMNN